MVIELSHLKDAIGAIDYLETKIPDALNYIGMSYLGENTEMILGYIRSKSPLGMRRSELLRKMQGKIDAKGLTEIVDTLVEAETVEVEACSRGGITYFIKGKRIKV